MLWLRRVGDLDAVLGGDLLGVRCAPLRLGPGHAARAAGYVAVAGGVRRRILAFLAAARVAAFAVQADLLLGEAPDGVAPGRAHATASGPSGPIPRPVPHAWASAWYSGDSCPPGCGTLARSPISRALAVASPISRQSRPGPSWLAPLTYPARRAYQAALSPRPAFTPPPSPP